MATPNSFRRNVAAILTFSRPLLVFFAFGSALWVMFTGYPVAYILGLSFLLLAMAFDWIDGWFATRYIPHSRLGPLVDRMMDRVVLSIIFPVLGVGMMWRYNRLNEVFEEGGQKAHLLHALLVLGICVIVLMRDQFAGFLRSIAQRAGQEVESHELTRLRTMVFSPMAVLLYAYAFYQPTSGWEGFYRWVNWINLVPLRVWFVIEIGFLVINIGSVTMYLRKYGAIALDDITEDDEILRRRILSVIPNALTLMNGLMGITAVIFVSYGRVREAVFTLLGATLMDRLDGLMARRLGLTDPPTEENEKGGVRLGAVLDDISDAISFALAPAAIFYLYMSNLSQNQLTQSVITAIALIYGLAGVSRLTYFTIDKHPIPGFFKGMPVPAAALLVAAPIEVTHQMAVLGSPYVGFWVMISAGTMVLAAVVMNVFPIRYLHVGRLMGRRPSLLRVSVLLWVVLVFTHYFGMALLALMLVYLFSPLYTTSRIHPSVAEVETRTPHTSSRP